jgi:hypothetical protein
MQTQLTRLPPRGLCAAAALAGLLAGCGPRVTKADLTAEEKHITKVGSLCVTFRSKQARLPKGVQELKDFAKKLKSEELAAHGIEELDRAFISPRDNEPYMLIRPEMAKPRSGGPPAMVLVYEKTGVNGKRMAFGGMGNTFEMDDFMYRQYVLGTK